MSPQCKVFQQNATATFSQQKTELFSCQQTQAPDQPLGRAMRRFLCHRKNSATTTRCLTAVKSPTSQTGELEAAPKQRCQPTNELQDILMLARELIRQHSHEEHIKEQTSYIWHNTASSYSMEAALCNPADNLEATK